MSNTKHVVDFNGKPLSEDDLEKMVTTSMNNFGAPDQLTMGAGDFSKLVSFFNIGPTLHPVMQKIATKLHCKLKIGSITWDDNNIMSAAADAFENIGVFRHVPKE